MPQYLLEIEIEFACPDPTVAAAVAPVIERSVVDLVMGGDLAPLPLVRVLASPVIELDEQEIRLRRMREDRLRVAGQLTEERLPYTTHAPQQLALAGL